MTCLDDCNELIRLGVLMAIEKAKPEATCRLCREGDPCWFHKPNFNTEGETK